jgi:hypothetical protein
MVEAPCLNVIRPTEPRHPLAGRGRHARTPECPSCPPRLLGSPRGRSTSMRPIQLFARTFHRARGDRLRYAFPARPLPRPTARSRAPAASGICAAGSATERSPSAAPPSPPPAPAPSLYHAATEVSRARWQATALPPVLDLTPRGQTHRTRGSARRFASAFIRASPPCRAYLRHLRPICIFVSPHAIRAIGGHPVITLDILSNGWLACILSPTRSGRPSPSRSLIASG